MGVADRGSFIWFLLSLTQVWLSVKLMDDVSAAVETLFGASAAACFVLAIIVFRQEQRDLLINPLKVQNKEVHPEEIAKQGKGTWIGVLIWLIAIITGSIILP
tara:strand:- start:1557 stop:1865 length:309 start_codon:yes stop_codon:yes gene_type:complete